MFWVDKGRNWYYTGFKKILSTKELYDAQKCHAWTFTYTRGRKQKNALIVLLLPTQSFFIS